MKFGSGKIPKKKNIKIDAATTEPIRKCGPVAFVRYQKNPDYDTSSSLLDGWRTEKWKRTESFFSSVEKSRFDGKEILPCQRRKRHSMNRICDAKAFIIFDVSQQILYLKNMTKTLKKTYEWRNSKLKRIIHEFATIIVYCGIRNARLNYYVKKMPVMK